MSTPAHALGQEPVQKHVFDNGVVSLWTLSNDTQAIADAVIAAAQLEPMAVAIVWYSRHIIDVAALGQTLSSLAPDLPVCGCSTCGEITPAGMQASGCVIVLLPVRQFDVSISLIKDIDRAGMQQIAQVASTARQSFMQSRLYNTTNTFALTLIDGLTFTEEATTAALQRGLDDIPLIGGSAGDDLGFDRTDLLHGGKVHERAAVLLLVHSRLPFRLFTDNNFVPTTRKLVVTRSDPDRRIVHELNGLPAASVYADAIGTTRDELNATSFAAHALILRIGGENFCRSIQSVNAQDDSLTFFCAIDDGLVLTVAESEGMVRSSRSMIDSIEADIGHIECMIGFDCIYRKLDAAHRGVTDRMESLLREKNFVGYNTYGEQFRSMHVNQTFTGVAFASPAT